MAFNTPLTKTENIVFGRGVLFFAQFDDNGLPLGERDLGETPGFTLSVASTKADVFSSRSGIGQKILTTTLSVSASAKIDVIDMSPDNIALFIAGAVATKAQTSGAVTAELIPGLQSDRQYQLGALAANPSGVRGVTAVAVRAKELKLAAARVNSTAYVVGDIFKSSTNVFIVTTAGTTAGSAPTYDTAAVGNTTTDGSAVVKYIGTTADATVTTDYLVSAESARVGIVVGGGLALAAALYTSVTTNYLTLSADYTKNANSRTQITSSGGASVTGQLRFIADNAIGDNTDLFVATCTVESSGDNAFITDNAPQKFSLAVDVNQKDTSTPQIICDGRVVA